MLGLPRGTVRLHEHDERWRDIFQQERDSIAGALGDLALGIEHVGSTSIPGIVAKPIIDIAVAVESFESGAGCVEPLEGLEYVYRGEYGLPGRRYFIKGEPRLFHIHMYPIDDYRWRNHLLFRDYLRRHPDLALEYDRLKKELAASYPDSRLEYTNAKDPFIARVLTLANQENR